MITRLGTLLALLLGLVLTQADQGHAFSIGLRATSDVLAITPDPPFPPTVTFLDTFSCIPGHACGSATSRYAVVGTSRDAIPALFAYDFTDTVAGAYSILFTATDLKKRLLARIRTSAFGDELFIEATGCGPQPGSCVSTLDTTGFFIPIEPSFPQVSQDEFGGFVSFGTGRVPFFLPVGPGTGIHTRVELTTGPGLSDLCLDVPEHCHSETSAVVSLIALPPPGAKFLEPVPEPTTLLLIGTTAAGLGLVRWRQRRRKRQPVGGLKA